MKRINDFLRNASDKALEKDISRFLPDSSAPKYGGTRGSDGARWKPSVNSKDYVRRYYFGQRVSPAKEYFAFEVLNYIGFSTPKSRPIFVRNFSKETDRDYLASKSFEGYIPIYLFLGESDIPDRFFNYYYLRFFSKDTWEQENYNPEKCKESIEKNRNTQTKEERQLILRAIQSYEMYGEDDKEMVERFKASSEEKLRAGFHSFSAIKIAQRYSYVAGAQCVYDSYDQKRLRISGNMAASLYGALLVQDPDFQPNSTNVGFVRGGNRLYFCVIDKDKAKFKSAENYEELSEVMSSLSNADIFKGVTKEQELNIAYNIHKLITSESDGRAPIDKIFFNPRTMKVIKVNVIQVYKFFLLQRLCRNLVRSLNDYSSNDPIFSEVQGLINDLYGLAEKDDQGNDYEKDFSNFMQMVNTKVIELFSDIKSRRKDLAGFIDLERINEEIKKYYEQDFNSIKQRDAILQNSKLILNHITNNNPENAVAEFLEREKIREKLADIILDKLTDVRDREPVRSHIIEDLTSVYYQDLFAKNVQISSDDLINDVLINRIIQDHQEELMVDNSLGKERKFTDQVYELKSGKYWVSETYNNTVNNSLISKIIIRPHNSSREVFICTEEPNPHVKLREELEKVNLNCDFTGSGDAIIFSLSFESLAIEDVICRLVEANLIDDITSQKIMARVPDSISSRNRSIEDLRGK